MGYSPGLLAETNPIAGAGGPAEAGINKPVVSVNKKWQGSALRRPPSARRGGGSVQRAGKSIVRRAPAFLAAAVLCGCASRGPSFNEEYDQIYDVPLRSSGALFAALPPAVQDTVRAETGSAEIERVVKNTSSGTLIYQIRFANTGLLPPLLVTPDGSVLDPEMRILVQAPKEPPALESGSASATVSLSDLPPAVVKSIQKHAPDAEVESILKQVHGDQTTYEVDFKGRMHPPLRLASDGTVLEK